MRRLLAVLCIVVALAVAMAASGSPPLQADDKSRPCDQLNRLAALSPTVLSGADIDSVRSAIIREWQLSSTDIMTRSYEEAVTLHWSKDGIAYVVTEGRGSSGWTFLDGRVKFERTYPSFNHLIQCLGWGDPDYYESTFEDPGPAGRMFSFAVYYAPRGVSIFTGQSWIWNVPDRPPALNANLAVHLLTFVRPGTIQSVYSAVVHAVITNPADLPKPWPGSWDKLECVIDLRRSK